MRKRHLLSYPMIPFCFRRSLAVRLAGLLFIQGVTMDELQAQEAKSIPGMIAEYEAKVRANTMKIIEAKTEEEKSQYRATVPSAAPYAARVLAAVESSTSTGEPVAGIIWLLTQAAGTAESEKALELLKNRYASAAGIAPAVKALEYRTLEQAGPVLDAIVKTNAHAEEKAAALYALGMLHFRQMEAAVDPAVAEAAKNKASDLFQELVATYPQTLVQGLPLADQAGKMLFEMSNLSVGSPVPEISGQDIDGQAFKISDYRGKHVVLVFWGGWCHACHGLLPMVNSLTHDVREKKLPVEVLGINTDLPSEAKAAYAQYQVNFRNWSDGTTSGPITSLFNLRQFPTLYLIGPDGRIELKQTSVEAVRERLKLLEGK